MGGVEGEVIELLSDVAPYNIRAASHLLASQIPWFPTGSLFLCVVDPGVGGSRNPVALQADGNWFVGPENGLFDVVAARSREVSWFHIQWRPEQLSASFHGRDLFAPIAARIATGRITEGDLTVVPPPQPIDHGDDLHEVIYLDRYGNAITGVRAVSIDARERLEIGGVILENSNTFSDVPVGTPFWYENSVGLVEIAINQGSAEEQLQVSVGSGFSVISDRQ